MTKLSKEISIILFTYLLIFIGINGWSQSINLKVIGTKEQGFNVDIYNGTQLLIHNTEEFKLKVANLD